MNGPERRYQLKEIKLEVTHRCELRCVHCSSNATRGSLKEISLAVVMDLLAQAVEMGVREIAFSGG